MFMVIGARTTLKHTLMYVTTVVLFALFWRAVTILEMTCNLAVVGTTEGVEGYEVLLYA